MWGAIISAAAPIIGGLLGKKKSEKTTSEIDYVKLRQNAEAAGFNPLTALRAGGGAGFTTTHHPAISSGQFIADALAGVGNAISQIDPMRDETARMEMALKRATLENIQADTAARKRASIGGVPVATGARAVSASPRLAKEPPAPKNLYEPWIDNSALGGGRTVWLPSAELPDAEQAIMAPVGTGQTIGTWGQTPPTGRDRYQPSLGQKAIRELTRPIVVKKLPPEESSWWPSIGIKWN